MKKILITGASGGFGRAACCLFLKNGFQVWGIDHQENNPPAGVHFIPADITDADRVTEAYQKISMETDHLDIILHTAGIYDLNSLLEISEEDFLRIFDINLFGAYRINKTFQPLLHAGSRIIFTSSELAPLDPLPFTGLYAMTKTALEKYADSLRMEVQLLGISVSVIRPGAIRTNLLNVSTNALDQFCEHTALYRCNASRFKRIVNSVESRSISPEQIASVALRASTAAHPKYVYAVNRNPLLLLLNVLPRRLQTWIIKRILK